MTKFSNLRISANSIKRKTWSKTLSSFYFIILLEFSVCFITKLWCAENDLSERAYPCIKQYGTEGVDFNTTRNTQNIAISRIERIVNAWNTFFDDGFTSKNPRSKIVSWRFHELETPRQIRPRIKLHIFQEISVSIVISHICHNIINSRF